MKKCNTSHACWIYSIYLSKCPRRNINTVALVLSAGFDKHIFLESPRTTSGKKKQKQNWRNYYDSIIRHIKIQQIFLMNCNLIWFRLIFSDAEWGNSASQQHYIIQKGHNTAPTSSVSLQWQEAFLLFCDRAGFINVWGVCWVKTRGKKLGQKFFFTSF